MHLKVNNLYTSHHFVIIIEVHNNGFGLLKCVSKIGTPCGGRNWHTETIGNSYGQQGQCSGDGRSSLVEGLDKLVLFLHWQVIGLLTSLPRPAPPRPTALR